ncbi:DNA mismatch repair protein MutL [Astathelohania contejeani]|uniref:DNA mismatch repair protein MutL n=1 Tax=Astathelohania contejeani TaxID=164912 RepID=A0ABQ7I1H3_9MICR|nr:DNA mismatch repair protein MutL [Thelohania contejeani]
MFHLNNLAELINSGRGTYAKFTKLKGYVMIITTDSNVSIYSSSLLTKIRNIFVENLIIEENMGYKYNIENTLEEYEIKIKAYFRQIWYNLLIKELKNYEQHDEKVYVALPWSIKKYSIEESDNILKEMILKYNYKFNNILSDWTTISKETLKCGTLIGQFNKEMIIYKIKTGIIIFDQHAVDERIRLEMLIRKYPNKGLEDLKTRACKGAIKFGDTLDKRKMETMIYNLLMCRLPFICAHGRPLLSIFVI